jgi:hypothetical protein
MTSACVVLTAVAGHAVPSADDVAFAVADTETIRAQAVLIAAANNTTSEVTCDVPTFVGVAATPATGFALGELYGNDAVAGTGTCVSLQPGTYTATLSMWVEWLDESNEWTVLPNSRKSFPMDAVRGVAKPTSVPYVVKYDAGGASGRPHRVCGHTTTTVNENKYPNCSPVYLSADDNTRMT